MIEHFLLGTLPAFWRRLCARTEESRAYVLLRRLYVLLRRLVRESLLGRLLGEHPQRPLRADAAVNAASRRLARFGARLHLDELFAGRSLRAPDFSCLAGTMLLAMFVCPARVWNNRFALGIAIALALALLLLVMAGRRRLLTCREIGLGFLFFMLTAVLGIVSARNTGEALRVSAFYVTSFLLALTLAAGLSDREKLKKFLAFLYLAVLWTALSAIWQRLTGVAANSSQTDLAANAGMPGRVYSTFENPNNYAEFLVLLLPLAFAYTTMLQNRRARLGATCLLALPLAALLMTYSRSGWVSFALAVLVLLFFCQRRMLPLLLLAALLALPLLPGSVFRRILTIGSTSDSSNLYRVYIWQGTLRLLRQFGLTGVGFGPENFHPVYVLFCGGHAREAQHAHMLWLEVWAEMGLAGFLGLLAFHFGLIRRALLRICRARTGVRMTLIAAAAALIGISFSATVEYIWFYPRDMFCFFIVVGVTLAALRISEAEEKQVKKQAPVL